MQLSLRLAVLRPPPPPATLTLFPPFLTIYPMLVPPTRARGFISEIPGYFAICNSGLQGMTRIISQWETTGVRQRWRCLAGLKMAGGRRWCQYARLLHTHKLRNTHDWIFVFGATSPS